MNWLIIGKDFKEEDLTPELKRIYNIYKDNVSKRSCFEGAALMKRQGKMEEYIHRCKFCASTTTYISFRVDRLKFEVSPKIGNKKVFLGSYDDFDDALLALKEYIKLLNEK